MIALVEQTEVKEKRQKTNIVHNCPQCKVVNGEEYYRTKISEFTENGRRRYFHTQCLKWKLRKELIKYGCKETEIAKEYIERHMKEDYEFIGGD